MKGKVVPWLLTLIVVLPGCESGKKNEVPPASDVYQFTSDGPGMEDGLTPSAVSALQRAPTWLYKDLLFSFKRLNESNQDRFADAILQASDPNFVDEIAFVVAHSSPSDLSSSQYKADLLEKNARLIYETAVQLQYLELVEVGDPQAGGEYSTTIRYHLPDRDLEIPKEMYYWFVVHPRLEDDRPMYIDPDTGRAPVGGATGVFWREWFFEHADQQCPGMLLCPGDPWTQPVACPVLKDLLKDETVLWKEKVGDKDDNGAIGAATRFIQGTVCFGAGAERPIQPVRIYRLHRGNCGEWADYTSAVGRTALIPTANIVAYANDHTWNEFYAGEWIQWEPVNTMINSPAYDKDGPTPEGGWWYLYGAMLPRGDGYAYNDTDFYGETSTLEVNVTDTLGNPVDGANVFVLASVHGMLLPVEADVTGFDGKSVFALGDMNRFLFAVQSPLGRIPETGGTLAISKSSIGETYTQSVVLPAARLALSISPAVPEPLESSLFRISVNTDFPVQWMPGASVTSGLEYTKDLEPGHVRVFVCDAANFNLYSQGQPFAAYGAKFGGTDSIQISAQDFNGWRVVVSNEESVRAVQVGAIDVSLVGEKEALTGLGTIQEEHAMVLDPGERFVLGIEYKAL